MLVGASCTAELIQDDPGGLAEALDLPVPVIPLELPAYQRKENWGAAETFYQLVRALRRAGTRRRDDAAHAPAAGRAAISSAPPRSASAIATTCARSRELLDAARHRRQRRRAARRHAGRPRAARATPTSTSCSTPRSPTQAAQLAEAHASASRSTKTVPIGVGATRDFIAEVARARRHRPDAGAGATRRSRLPWYSRSVDSTYLTGKRVFIFGDATHAVAAARIAAERARLQRRRPRHLQPRVRPRGARRRQAATASRR